MPEAMKQLGKRHQIPVGLWLLRENEVGLGERAEQRLMGKHVLLRALPWAGGRRSRAQWRAGCAQDALRRVHMPLRLGGGLDHHRHVFAH